MAGEEFLSIPFKILLIHSGFVAARGRLEPGPRTPGQPGPHPINHRLNMADSASSHKYGRQHQHTVVEYCSIVLTPVEYRHLDRGVGEIWMVRYWNPTASIIHHLSYSTFKSGEV